MAEIDLCILKALHWITLVIPIFFTVTYTTITHTTALRDNFSGFACLRNLILSEFQYQFCACSAQPEQKYTSESLFDTNMPAALRVGDCILVVAIKIKFMVI